MTRKSVQGGYCAYPDTVDCALQKTDCDDPANFMSTRQMQGGPVNAHGGSCRWQSSVVKHIMGRCVDAVGLPTECAPNPDSCPAHDGSHEVRGWLPESSPVRGDRDWVWPADECKLGDTVFGRCDYGMCAWSHEHCVEDNTWEPFSEGCTCDKVMVGGCSRTKNGEKEVYCAVSKDACDDEQSWIVPVEVQNAAGFQCFLCREVREDPVSDPSANNNIPPILTNDPFSSGGGRTQSQMAIIAIVSLGTLLAASIIGFVGWRALRTRRAINQKKEAIIPLPATIRVSDGEDHYHANNDNDNVSVSSAMSEDTCGVCK